jgi:hypothetical protein
VQTTDFDVRAARAARVEDAFLWPTTIAAIACLPVFLAPLVFDAAILKDATYIADWVIWGVFALEAIVVLILVPDRMAWLRHHRLIVFILIAAFPGFAILFKGTQLDGLTPALILAQKLLKLAKVDRLLRKRTFHARIPGGRWILLLPAIVADILVWQRLGAVPAMTLAVALLLALVGSGRRPDPAALARLGRRAVASRRHVPLLRRF